MEAKQRKEEEKVADSSGDRWRYQRKKNVTQNQPDKLDLKHNVLQFINLIAVPTKTCTHRKKSTPIMSNIRYNCRAG